MSLPAPYPEPDLETLLRPRRRPPVRLQVLLYVLTGLTTFAAGAVGWDPETLLGSDESVAAAAAHWQRGLAYMVAVMATLTAHEAGHFIAARRHGIPVTLPFFIPMPVLLTGTMGAVIAMDGARADRRQLFDIAVAGPLAGLALAVPLLAFGMAAGLPDTDNPFALAPLASWIQGFVRPDLPGGVTVAPNPFFMAGWVGLLVTGLNMVPVSQLDGGHICRAVFGAHGNGMARTVLVACIAAVLCTGQLNWVPMLVLVILMGVDHPPLREDGRPLGWPRTLLGLGALLIPLATFMPEPIRLP